MNSILTRMKHSAIALNRSALGLVPNMSGRFEIKQPTKGKNMSATPAAPAPATPTPTPTPTPTETEHRATVEPRVGSTPDDIVKRFSLIASAAGLIPFPIIDLTAVLAIQLKMLKELSDHYGIRFSEHRVKNVLGSLIGSFVAPLVTPIVVSMVKSIPGVGTIAAFLALPGIAAASTYAVGRVFIQHFESGGTFLDFDPEKTRAFYQQQLREAQKNAEELKTRG